MIIKDENVSISAVNSTCCSSSAPSMKTENTGDETLAAAVDALSIDNSTHVPFTLTTDFDLSGMHAVVPLSYCEHLKQVKPLPSFDFINVYAPCKECNTVKENWICLTCFEVFCSRFVNSHMVEHFMHVNHAMVLSFSDLSIWCYNCDSYLENDILNEAKASAYKSKFNETL